MLILNIYGMKEVQRKYNDITSIRHVITPSIRYSFSPSGKKYYREYSYNMGSEIITKYYSIFENSLYAGPSKNASNLLSIDISNNLEIKVPSKTDTSGYTKVPIFEALSFSSGYDFTADTAKLQNFNLNGRTTLFKVVSINFSGYWDPYIYKKRADGYYENTNILRFQDKMWPELRNFNFSVSTSLNSVKLFNNKNPNTLTAEQIQTLKLIDDRPEDFAAFNIPWDFSVNYSYNYNKSPGRPSISNQTLNFSGTLTVTTNFSVKFTSGYDFKNNDIAPTQIGITRNLHCWSLSIDWVPFGYYKSYFITLRANSSMLQDIKITKQQPYYMNEIYH
ncbi:MAG: putative LPS assembly protein LptD [Solitalea-like symbiont of Acarus siro]